MRSQQWRVKRCVRRDFGRIKYVPCDEARGEGLGRVEKKVVAEVPKFFKSRVSTPEIASIPSHTLAQVKSDYILRRPTICHGLSQVVSDLTIFKIQL